MTPYDKALALLRAERPVSPELAEASLAQALTRLDARFAVRLRLRRVFGGVVGLTTCLFAGYYLAAFRSAGPAPRPSVRTEAAVPGPQAAPQPDERTSQGEASSAAPTTEQRAVAADTASQSAPHSRPAKRKLRLDSAAPTSPDAAAEPLHQPAEVPPVAAPSAPENPRASYEAAHRLQFSGAPAAALAAWDQFLAAQPTGSLAIEARYYRGLTLLRLGQREAARAALTPFARGDYGGFRRHDAERWLKQLE